MIFLRLHHRQMLGHDSNVGYPSGRATLLYRRIDNRFPRQSGNIAKHTHKKPVCSFIDRRENRCEERKAEQKVSNLCAIPNKCDVIVVWDVVEIRDRGVEKLENYPSVLHNRVRKVRDRLMMFGRWKHEKFFLRSKVFLTIDRHICKFRRH